ncbi:MAG TPA: Gfo/Idh/MocA family oxidoreductase [Longimicrobiales bacterium]
MIDVVIIGAGARGNRVFADLIATHDTGFSLCGVVEPDARRRAAFQHRYGIPAQRAFASVEDLVAVPRLGDMVFICTPDPTHFEVCRAVSAHGYDVLLEKPIATNLPDCLALFDLQQACGNRIYVAHVMRYAPFFRKVKEIVDSGRFGAVRHIQLAENVGHWHFAHSYVRGNWRRSDTSAPIILTKSSHDLDLLYWLVGRPVVSVVSHGSLSYFTEANAPEGSAGRCVDCELRDRCIFSATRFYLNDRDEWPFDIIAPGARSLTARRRALETGPYGRCVWRCDNDVCDIQTVVLEFDSGLLAMFGLYALTADNTRKLTIQFDEAELFGDVRRNRLEISHFVGRKDELLVEEVALPGTADSHGGGDLALLQALNEHLNGGEHLSLVTSLETSLPSHVLAFLAEESRRNGSRRIEVPPVLAGGRDWMRPPGRGDAAGAGGG